MVTKFDEPNEDTTVSSVPNAMVLFNPAVVLTEIEGKSFVRNPEQLADRTGVTPKEISPYDHVTKGQPPHYLSRQSRSGVKYASVEVFTETMKKAGNRCKLVGYDDQPHGFSNYGRLKNKPFLDTVEKIDRLLVSLGYLKGNPTVREQFQ